MGEAADFGHIKRGVDVALTAIREPSRMGIRILHQIRVAIDCECGATVDAPDGDELLDELLEHIASVHEVPMRTELDVMLGQAYET